jgi:hypothetical protein
MIEKIVRARNPPRIAGQEHTETVAANSDPRFMASLKTDGLISLKHWRSRSVIVDDDAPGHDREAAFWIELRSGEPINEDRRFMSIESHFETERTSVT